MVARSPYRVRRVDNESGFTLIELMVVVLIIGILIAIALPTFLGARKRAADRAAETRLRTTFTATRLFYIDNSSFVGVDGPGVVNAIETSVQTNTLPVAIDTEVSIRDVSDDTLLLVTQSSSGAFVCMADDTAGQIRGLDETGDSFTTIADCQAAPQQW